MNMMEVLRCCFQKAKSICKHSQRPELLRSLDILFVQTFILTKEMENKKPLKLEIKKK